jgi:hypothetical protein
MKKSFSHLSRYRERSGPLGSNDTAGRNGAFFVPHPNGLTELSIIATCGEVEPLWEHVSVKARTKGAKFWRTPNWEEMCFVKGMFWNDNETVVQYHPPESEMVNIHPAVLHLWKPVGREIPMPPREYV